MSRKYGLRLGMLDLVLALVIVLGGCGSGGGGGKYVPPAPAGVRLTSITIDPNNPAIAAGTSVQLQATGNYSNGTTRNLTDTVTWTSNDGTIAQVSSSLPTKGLTTGRVPVPR